MSAAAPKEAASGAGKAVTVRGRRAAPPAPREPKPESERILDLVEKALDRGQGPELVETVKQLVQLRNHQEDRAAAKEFFEALARVRGKLPAIVKNRTGKNTSQQAGASFDYKYADLNQVATIAGPHLTAEGFIWYWTTLVEEGFVTKYCHLRHVGGHEEVSPAKIPTASRGGMSEQQKISAAGTFAMRLSLVDVLGLTTADPDLDGQQASEYERITEGELSDIEALITEIDTDGKRGIKVGLLKWLRVEKLADAPRSKYTTAVKMLERKRAQPPASAEPPKAPTIAAAGAQESLL